MSTTRLAAALGGPAVLVFAVLKLAAHILTTGSFGYGFFVDELYFLACAEHLDWGFVDMPPLLPAVTAAVRALLGDSLLAIRIVPALLGAGLVILTGVLAREMGGGRFAAGLASLGAVVAPVYLAVHAYHSMNAIEPILWTGCALLLIRLARGADPRLWLAFGVLAGLGLLNKHTMLLFGFALVVGLLLTPDRRLMASRWFWAAGAIAFLSALPNLVWMIAHGFPHLEMLANIRASRRDVTINPASFLGYQALLIHPLAVPLALVGLGYLLVHPEGRRHRALGLAFVVTLGILMAMNARPYYLAPAYPLPLAAGAVAVERAWRARWRWLRPAYSGLLAAAGVLLAPTVLPCLPPEAYVRYTEVLGLAQPRVETHRLGRLPQLFADRFGWPEIAAEVARIYHALPPEDRARAAIFGQNYGQAGAIDLYGPELGLPKALSGHLTYHYWGPRHHTGDVVIVMDDDRETLEGHFEQVEWAGAVRHPYSMPYQNFDVFVCRRMRAPLAEVWPRLKQFN
jgi:4-amino-4-deoxy-L-arabinose transferase-like glycosyltransferase